MLCEFVEGFSILNFDDCIAVAPKASSFLSEEPDSTAALDILTSVPVGFSCVT
jgi:hypothetical protein